MPSLEGWEAADAMTPDEVIAVLLDVDRGLVTLDITIEDRELASSEPEYTASNGWRFRVFDDLGAFGYIDSVAAPGGEWFDLWPSEGTDEFGDLWGLVRHWSPLHLQAWQWSGDGMSPDGWPVSLDEVAERDAGTLEWRKKRIPELLL